jgi:hypothetical protein
MPQTRDIKYINRDFADFRKELIEFAKNYFPDTYNDFSEASPGMMFIEMVSYVGTVLGFYQDTQLQETFLQYAKNQNNLYDLAYTMGYRPKVTSVAEAEVEIIQLIDSIETGGEYSPDYNQAAVVYENTQLQSTVGRNLTFLTSKKVDFAFSSSYDPTEVLIEEIDSNGIPITFRLTKKVKVYSGAINTLNVQVGSLERFKTIEIEDTDIVKILDITDSDQNSWYEVPYLGQSTRIIPTENTGVDRDKVPQILQVEEIPRRFVTRYKSPTRLEIQFGSGILGTTDGVYTPDPTNVGLGVPSPLSRIDYAYDPANFLQTQNYGLAPSNTVLTIRYISGGGVQANVPSNTITNYIGGIIVSSGTDTSKLETIEFNNPEAAQGGKDGDTIEELRQNALRSFNEQLRTVTAQDYIVRTLSLPSEYGSIAKVHVSQFEARNVNNPLAINLHVLAYDQNRNLTQSTPTLGENLKKYITQYIPVTDSINIIDGFIVNIGVNYDIIVRPNFNSREVLRDCNIVLINFFDVRNWNINQPINLSEIYTLLDKVRGIQTIQNVKIHNLTGGPYSEYEYDIQGATRNNIVYPSYDPMMFEVKFPTVDIKGRITTL